MSTDQDNSLTEEEQQYLNVLRHQDQKLKTLGTRADGMMNRADVTIEEAERVLEQLGRSVSRMDVPLSPVSLRPVAPKLRSWEEIVAEAEQAVDGQALMSDILSPAEIEQVEQRLALLRGDFDAIHRLDKIDWAICGVAGVLAALVDIFLIQMPAHPGFLGGEASQGGPLANWIREKINSTFSPEEIKRLEKEYWVPYDPAHSANLGQRVAGLGPGTHRYQSLGHDPILGFIFGVKDILMGTFTAIDSNGRLIVQQVDIKDPSTIGMNLFEAIGRVFGHLKSDVATPRGLPAPLMPLFQFLQVGKVGKRGYTIGEVTRIMYRSGYDFRHFIAMSISPLLIEVIVRVAYFAKRLVEGYSFAEAIPVDLPTGQRQPKLQTMLFSAHLMATAANAGKVIIGQNPLLINYPQWLAFFRYALPQLKWVLLDKENEKFRYVQTRIDAGWEEFDRDLKETWGLVFRDPILLN